MRASTTSRLLGHLNLFALRIIFCKSWRNTSERIGDLDHNQPVIDIGLALFTYCWWCMCKPWVHLEPGTGWVRTLISDRWNMAKWQHPSWCLRHSALMLCWWSHRGSAWWLCILEHPLPAATSPLLCSGLSVLLWGSPEVVPLKVDIAT